jgi:hypothetical protein
MCRETNELCTSNGFSSGFVQLDEKNGLLVQYNVKPEDAKGLFRTGSRRLDTGYW